MAKKDTLNKCKTQAKKAAAQKEYEAANNEVRKSAKHDKQNYTDALAQEAEEATGKNNLKELYMTTRKLVGKFRQTKTSKRQRSRQWHTCWKSTVPTQQDPRRRRPPRH